MSHIFIQKKCLLLVAFFAVLLVVAGSPWAQTNTSLSRVKVIGEDGVPLTSGEVEFFLDDAQIMLLTIAADGTIEIDRGKLTSGKTYTISVLNEDLDEIYATRSWVYDAARFDPEWDAELGHNKYALTVTLQGKSGRDLSLEAARSVNAEWQEATENRAKESVKMDVIGPPKFVVALSVVFMFGNFGADESALAGVASVDPGLALAFGYRHGYPADPTPNTWLRYREATIAYAQNRYTTNQVADPTQQSDVTFHRVGLAYGLGQMKGKHDLSAAVAIAIGGIYDASNKLEFNGRTYSLFGIGVRGRYIFEAIGGGGIDFGLMGELGLMFYPADSQDNDHWYGLAPSIGLGVVVH